MRRVLIVAHPDDESLFFGGLLVAEPGDWTVIACSIPRRDPIRAWKFFTACDLLGARGRLLPFPETDPGEPLSSLYALDLAGFDQIVTHSPAGEYGHAHHKLLHRFLSLAYPEKLLAGCYGCPMGAKVIALSPAQWERKQAAILAYDHVSPSDGIPKGEALLRRYGGQFDLAVESYARA